MQFLASEQWTHPSPCDINNVMSARNSVQETNNPQHLILCQKVFYNRYKYSHTLKINQTFHQGDI